MQNHRFKRDIYAFFTDWFRFFLVENVGGFHRIRQILMPSKQERDLNFIPFRLPNMCAALLVLVQESEFSTKNESPTAIELNGYLYDFPGGTGMLFSIVIFECPLRVFFNHTLRLHSCTVLNTHFQIKKCAPFSTLLHLYTFLQKSVEMTEKGVKKVEIVCIVNDNHSRFFYNK